MTQDASLVWFRRDLRLADNPALSAALRTGGPVIPVFIWAPEEDGSWAPGAASRWWLHHALAALDTSLRTAGSRLVIRRGHSLQTLQDVADAAGARRVFWNRLYEPRASERDAEAEKALREVGLQVESRNAALLFEPWAIRNKQGGPYQVFTQFWRRCLEEGVHQAPSPAPKRLTPPRRWPESLDLRQLGLLPTQKWADNFSAHWKPGERGAAAALKRFLKSGLDPYPTGRDIPAKAGTSRLSPHLHFGEIGPRQVWNAVKARANSPRRRAAADAFLRELGWREFAHHLLHHFPLTPERPLRASFERFRWRHDAGALKAWQKGLTGYPIVDAGLRELWQTGWMHNRVRMIVGSFLVKDLLLSWREGESWFWDTLADADLANNTLGWQWIGGCGADAAPYFRVFNPVLQGERYDPKGAYIRRWVPELARLPDRWIHQPWEAPADVLKDAGVRLGETYPLPLVDHEEARSRALSAFKELR